MAPPVEKLIAQLKALYAVRTDEALAARLGSTKSAIAKWRSRGSLPAVVHQRVAKEYGPFYGDTFIEDSELHTRAFDIPRGLALYVYDRERAALSAFPTTADALLAWGFYIGDIERILRGHIASSLTDVANGRPLIERCVTQIDGRMIPELEKMVAQAKADHFDTFA